MKVAIACSGLGRVQRGIEVWAKALAEGLHREGQDVVLFHGGNAKAFDCPNQPLRFFRRGDRWTRIWTRLAPAFMWRWGQKSTYEFEQRSFASAMLPHLGRGAFDVVHTQDVEIARAVERERRANRLDVATVFAHGTNEDAQTLAQFRYLQHITPAAAANARQEVGENPLHFTIPNFLDPARFGSESDSSPERVCAARERWNIPHDAYVIGCAGVLIKDIKRMDALIPEVERLLARDGDVFLFLVGHATSQTESIEREARSVLGDRQCILRDLPFKDMPDFYHAIDLFVLPCEIETFGICLVEAMSGGVPVVAHHSPVLRSVVGDGGWCVDVGRAGFLKAHWDEIRAGATVRSSAARRQAHEHFTWQVVYPQFKEMYGTVSRDHASRSGA